MICSDAISAVPDVQQLSAVCFPDKAIVIEFIDHNSFPRPERDQIRVDGSSKEATSEFISKTKAILYGGGAQTAGNSEGEDE